ncbi:hypothetical protein C4K04_1599 [Pseudomonas chlororaphis]|uniref:Integrase n=1 Tax=Pseudomonas chlororaphis TaxID=587753 RepID=A0A3G7TLS1_9PSED|nr:hypothetical protein [Pseudomonas chlororaphis]AZE47289.1 hypothetical protein C4K04_1599 [Pseudomonas chlororaphis]
MINTSQRIMLAPAINIQKEVCCAFDTLCEQMRHDFGNKIDQALNSFDRQGRSRFSLFILKSLTGFEKFKKADLDQMYDLAVIGTSDTVGASSIYEKLTGCLPVLIEDAMGLRVSFRAMFVILWSKGLATLPYTFELQGVWAKFPTLEPLSKGFVYEHSQGFPETIRASRVFQYRTNWIKARDVNLEELWDAAPYICDNRMSDTKDFRYLPWIKNFSAKYPDLLSPDDAYYLEKYHQYLHAKSSASISAHDSKMRIEEFKDYFAVPPEDAVAMTPKQRKRARNSYRADLSRKHNAIRKRVKDEAIVKKISENNELTIEQRSMLVPRPERNPKNFEWLKNNHYTGREHINIESLSRYWLTAANYYLQYLEKENLSTKWRATKVRTIAFLMDYLFCYLPMWIEANPHSVVRFPERPSEFERVLFWNNTISQADLDDNVFGLESSFSGINLPSTLIQHFDMTYSAKTKASFVATIHEFFEVIITNKAFVKTDGEWVVEKGFENPVSLLLDRSGSGARGSTDKVPLPLDSTVIAKAYLQAVEKVGVALQQQILTGKLSGERLDNVRQAEWINLSEIGLSHTIQIKNPDDQNDAIVIPLSRIINVYSWHSSLYGAATTEVYMPWISVVRMLSIALHGGLRLQNCQWLDINTFDKLLSKPENRVFDSCILYVNTDKDGQDRPVVIPDEAMASLVAERHFQREIYKPPLLPTHYENDPKDPKEYGEIYALFRSPWNGRGLPFSDSNYAEKWTLLLYGIQETYNNLVPLERQHQFVTYNKNGQMKSIHTPHSLRATWLTHFRIYGHLDIRVAQQQVAHKNPYTTDYYTIPVISESIKAISESNNLVMRSAWAQIAPAANNTYESSNAITSGWNVDRKKLAHDQNFISVTSAMIEHEKTGMQIIASDKDPDVGFYSNCICLRNGNCPKRLTDFTDRARVCGLCPIAVFGIDHLPAINCLIRKLAGESESLVIKLKGLKASKANRHEIEAVHHDLTVTKLELGSYHLISQALKDRLEQEKSEPGLITRMRDLKNFQLHEIDMNNPAQRVIAQLLDSKDHPQFTSHNYPYMIEKIAKNPDLLKIAIAQGSDRDRYVGQILSIMTTMSLSLADIAERINSKALALSDQL